MYKKRFYRMLTKTNGLISFNVTIKETDLYIKAEKDLRGQAEKAVMKCRKSLEKYIRGNPGFLGSLKPAKIQENAPLIVKQMAKASKRAGVGPMASIAGIIAEFVGKELLKYSPEIIVENGGDIFMKIKKKRIVGIYTGVSKLNGKFALEILPKETPLGICTSSGTMGHSLSFGRADAVVCISKSTALADAAATGVGNLVKEKGDIERAIKFARSIKGLKGIVIVKGEKAGFWGDIKIVRA